MNEQRTERNNVFHASPQEKNSEKQLLSFFKDTPVPDDELLSNLGLYLTSKTFSRLTFFYELYKKLVNQHGVIMEFGTRWGHTASILMALRGMFEPFNRTRKIIAFDTFEGHFGSGDSDCKQYSHSDGDYSVSDNYEIYLENLLNAKEQLESLTHLKKFEICKGDAGQNVTKYLEEHPETIISMAVFDMDLYKPTKQVLEAIQPYLAKGSILVFDELVDDVFPGETQALREVLGIKNVRVQRLPMTSRLSFLEVE